MTGSPVRAVTLRPADQTRELEQHAAGNQTDFGSIGGMDSSATNGPRRSRYLPGPRVDTPHDFRVLVTDSRAGSEFAGNKSTCSPILFPDAKCVVNRGSACSSLHGNPKVAAVALGESIR